MSLLSRRTVQRNPIKASSIATRGRTLCSGSRKNHCATALEKLSRRRKGNRPPAKRIGWRGASPPAMAKRGAFVHSENAQNVRKKKRTETRQEG